LNSCQRRVGKIDPRASREQAVRIARYVSIFGILPTTLTIIAISLENVNSLRPHGGLAFVLSTYGIAIPLTIILSSKKLKIFVRKLFSEKNNGMTNAQKLYCKILNS
jgi:hypothetical protein